ncbi:MAG: response regulator transcription factor [Gammaproteobacteria bacterium]|nr:response regulator transcription factor [Gammaproteobacteria bacterium]MCF6231059.1 response regulator transcription factor [Gammaproteobacteria bacterium]
MKIGLLEDDPHVAELTRLWLVDAGYEVTVFATGEALMAVVADDRFDLLIIDWILPGIQGDAVLSWLRENLDWLIPILFVTRKEREEDVVYVLELGADDYISKPVSQPILLARIRALLRRSQLCKKLRCGDMTFPPYKIDPAQHRILKGGVVVDLTQKEYELALFLFKNIGRVISRREILESVWGISSDVNTRTVDTHVSRLRNKLGFSTESGIKLSAIYQHGYRLERVEVVPG